MKHKFFQNIDWEGLRERKVISSFFKPREILKLQFFKVHNRAPASEDEYL